MKNVNMGVGSNVWHCKWCPHEVRIHENNSVPGEAARVSIFVWRGEREYNLCFIFPAYPWYLQHPNKFAIVELHVDGDKLLTREVYSSKEIPDITPSNAAEKLSLYLTYL